MKNRTYIKSFLIVILMVGFTFSLSAQEVEENLTSGKEIMVGVWKVDIPSQQRNLDASEQSNLTKLDSKEQESFWEKSNSWVYALTEEYFFRMSWAENGEYFEETGIWDYDVETMLLSLKTEQETFQYRVNHLKNSMIWISLSNSKEQFKTLYIKGIAL
ncbi:hypothetical protein JYB64_19400 [Algoriphagus aestuarii]|nr:hypothetical protein [Algoriphagus aestuarii]